MANLEQLAVLQQGVDVWNQWRRDYFQVEINFYEADLRKANLREVNLREANLGGADLNRADLSEANLGGADLSRADLSEANFRGAYFSAANLSGANLSGADFSGAYFSGANLNGANLSRAYFIGTDLRGVDLSGANLSGAYLSRADLSRVDLSRTNLSGANLSEANLNGTNLSEANLSGVDLREANLNGVNLSSSDLSQANLSGVDLSRVDLNRAYLIRADLRGVDLSGANLSGVSFRGAYLGETTFGNIDLSETLGLEDIFHRSPSNIGTSTLQRSKGKIPVEFLRGCGLSDFEIESAKLYNPDLTNQEINDILYKIYDLRARQTIQVSPLFISYSRKDDIFVNRLEVKLNESGIRFWRDIHDAKAGRLETQIEQAIRHNPTVLLVLSENALESDWVQHEVRKARGLEKELGRDVLCPVTLDDGWKSSRWPERVMEQVMEYNILDFSQWQDDAVFQRMFVKLLDGLQLFYKK